MTLRETSEYEAAAAQSVERKRRAQSEPAALAHSRAAAATVAADDEAHVSSCRPDELTGRHELTGRPDELVERVAELERVMRMVIASVFNNATPPPPNTALAAAAQPPAAPTVSSPPNKKKHTIVPKNALTAASPLASPAPDWDAPPQPPGQDRSNVLPPGALPL